MAMKPNPIILTFEFEPTYTGGKRIKKTMTPDQIAAYESFIPETQRTTHDQSLFKWKGVDK